MPLRRQMNDEHAEPLHIQPARKLTGWISGVHLL